MRIGVIPKSRNLATYRLGNFVLVPTVENTKPAEESVRTSDPLARALFFQLRNRSLHERRYVFEALNAAVCRGEISSPRLRMMKSSLALYLEATGKIPSKVAYEKWRKERNDLGLCPVNRIVRQFGTWNGALNDLGFKPMADPTALRVLTRGRKISNEEALQALSDCAADLGSDDFTIAQYEKWAKKELLKPESRGRAIPISKSIATRRFGTVRQAKIAAGLDPNSPYHSTSAFTDEDLIRHLAEARGEIEGRLSTAKYTVWRRRKQEEAKARGEIVKIPCTFTFHNRFRGWLKAVEKVEGLPIAAHEHRGPPVFTPDWLAEQLMVAYDELGEPFFTSTYIKWVREQRKHTKADFPPPDYTTVVRHGGPWPEVREKVRLAVETGDVNPLIDQLRTGGMNE